MQSRITEEDPLQKIKGFDPIKQEFYRLLKLLELSLQKNINLGIVITGPVNSGKYFMVQTFSQATKRSIHSFDYAASLKECLVEISSLLSSANPSEKMVILIRHIDQMEESEIDQLNEYLLESQNDIIFLSTAEETEGSVQYAKDIGLINHSIPVNIPTLQDTAAFLEYLVFEKYKDVHFEISIDEISAITYQYSYSTIDMLLYSSIIDSLVDHVDKIDLNRFMKSIMHHRFNRFSIQEDFPKSQLQEASIHEIGHALVGILMNLEIGYSCICKHGKAESIGFTTVLHDASDLKYTSAGMMKSLGGMAAEEICNGYVSVGSKSDIEKVISSLKESITEHGTSGLEYVDIKYNYGPAEHRAICEQTVQEELLRIYENTKSLLFPYKDTIFDLASQLLQHEYLLGSTIKSFI